MSKIDYKVPMSLDESESLLRSAEETEDNWAMLLAFGGICCIIALPILILYNIKSVLQFFFG